MKRATFGEKHAGTQITLGKLGGLYRAAGRLEVGTEQWGLKHETCVHTLDLDHYSYTGAMGGGGGGGSLLVAVRVLALFQGGGDSTGQRLRLSLTGHKPRIRRPMPVIEEKIPLTRRFPTRASQD